MNKKDVVRITEKDLVLPALKLIADKPGITTSALIEELTNIFQPEGKDAEIINGRNDTYFSQKVRNLKSHNTITPFTDYDSVNNNWVLNQKGEEFLADHNLETQTSIQLLRDKNKHDAKIVLTDIKKIPNKKRIFIYDENDVVNEGQIITTKSKTKNRSQKLRNAAIQHFTEKGSIKCALCGFDFEKTYGEYGKGFIEVHHIKPIYQFTSDDETKTIKDAIKNLMPLCSNCHRIVHRNPTIPLDALIKKPK